MSMPGSGYEFSSDQNKLIGSLAGKMSFVGMFAVFLGILYLVIALQVVAAVYRDRIPAEWKAKTKEYMDKAREKLPEDVRKQADEYSLDKLPANNHLWGIALGTGASGLFYLLLGIWTRTAASSFSKIVTTQTGDIRNLMDGMESLHKMYSLLYTLLVLIVLLGLVSLGISLFKQFSG